MVSTPLEPRAAFEARRSSLARQLRPLLCLLNFCKKNLGTRARSSSTYQCFRATLTQTRSINRECLLTPSKTKHSCSTSIASHFSNCLRTTCLSSIIPASQETKLRLLSPQPVSLLVIVRSSRNIGRKWPLLSLKSNLETIMLLWTSLTQCLKALRSRLNAISKTLSANS